jgi:hypothetical protein
MTTPPGGPYGQDPYGQDPYGTNPYGQNPYWGGQPQGSPYPYPPPGQYTNPYPTQPYPQAGQQIPAGWPGGPYPPGPPPKGPGSKAPWLIIAGLAVLGVIALVVTLIVVFSGNGNKSAKSNPSRLPVTTGAPTSQPNESGQIATDCTPNVSGGDKPAGGAPVSAGTLSFPANAAPGWMPFSDDQTPNLIDAVGLAQEVPGASQWVMQAEIATTNFVSSMDVSAQASKLMQCVANGPGYANASPTLGPTKTSSITVDGTKAARVDADVTIADPARNVKGDSVTVIAVDTKPVAIFLGATPIGDAASAATLNHVISALKVSK